MKEEEVIAAGISRGLERGQSIEQVVKSFINANYSRTAVAVAVNLVKQQKMLVSFSESSQDTPKPSEKKSIRGIVAIVFLLLLTAAAIAAYFFVLRK